MRNVKLLWGIIILLGATCLVLFRIAMVGSAAPDSTGPANGDKAAVVATIGDKKITRDLLEEQVYHKYGQEMMTRMLDHLAIQLEADKRKLQVGEPEITDELHRMQAGYENEEQFYKSMQEQVGMTREELHEDVYFKLLVEKAVTSDIVVGDNEVNDYMKENPDEFAEKLEFHLQIILNETLEQANRTYELAIGGADFSTLAKERSLDINTASEGGDLGWVEENDPFLSVNILEKARLLEIGEIGKPIETSEGYVVIKMVDREQEEQADLEVIRENVRKQIALQKALPIKEYILTLRDKWHTEIHDPALKAGESASNKTSN